MYCKCQICYSGQVVSGCFIAAEVVDVLQVLDMVQWTGCLRMFDRC